ncbi:methyltransferase [Bacteroidota bacterium]
MTANSQKPSLPPTWMVKAIQRMREALLSAHDRMFPRSVVLYEKFQYFYLLPSLYVAAELDIAGILKNSKKAIDELAKESGADTDSLYRVMRALASQHIFRESGNKMFSNNRLSRPLMDGDGSLRHMLRHHLGPLNWQITGDLLETVKTGKDGFNIRYNKNIYDFLSEDPGNSGVFDRSMSDLSSLGLAPLLKAYDFSTIQTLADVGGGEGFLLANILNANPSVKGILFDLPSAVEKARNRLEQHGLLERVQMIEGSFLETIPEGADTYLLKNILHNWNDETCVTILSNIRKALTSNGKVILVEMIVPAPNKASAATMIDIQMLTSMPGGKERTKEEFGILLDRAGLLLSRVYPTIAPISIIEAQPKN